MRSCDLAGHSGAVTGLAFSPDGSSLVSSSDDGSARIWDITPAQEALTLTGASGAGDQVAFTPDGLRLVGVGEGVLKVWDSISGQELYAAPGALYSSLAVSPDGTRIALVSAGTHVKLLAAASAVEQADWSAHTGRINALAFSPAGDRLATASDDFKVKLWDASAAALGGQPLSTLDLPDSVRALAFSPDGAKLVAGVNNGTLVIWDLESQGAPVTFRGHSDAVVSSPSARMAGALPQPGWMASPGCGAQALGSCSPPWMRTPRL